MSVRRPPPLARGDVVGLFSPSSEIASFPRRTARAVEALAAAGYVPRLAPNARARRGRVAGSAQERVADLHALVADDAVRAILCTTGGYSSNGLLAHVDYALLRARPTILCGYSDATALLCAVYARAGLVTFHGPALLPTFGEYGGPFRYSLEAFERVVGGAPAPLDLAPPAETTDAFAYWDREDDRPRVLVPASPWRCVAPGRASGPLLGGNLTTLVRLVGTPFVPDFRGAVLFVEETGSSPAQVEAHLRHLEHAGLLARIAGLAFGRPAHFADEVEGGLQEVIGAFAKRHGFPAISGVDFGHTDPRLTLPIGVACALDADAGRMTLLEHAVAT